MRQISQTDLLRTQPWKCRLCGGVSTVTLLLLAQFSVISGSVLHLTAAKSSLRPLRKQLSCEKELWDSMPARARQNTKEKSHRQRQDCWDGGGHLLQRHKALRKIKKENRESRMGTQQLGVWPCPSCPPLTARSLPAHLSLGTCESWLSTVCIRQQRIALYLKGVYVLLATSLCMCSELPKPNDREERGHIQCAKTTSMKRLPDDMSFSEWWLILYIQARKINLLLCYMQTNYHTMWKAKSVHL